MVKGVTRRVIVMRSPDPQLFEEAIFIVNGDLATGVTPDALLREAQQVASGYVRQNLNVKKRRPLPRFLWALFGALPVAAAWAVSVLL